MVKLTEEHLFAVRAAGACTDRSELYSAGQDLSEVSTGDLEWVEENLPELAHEIAEEASAGVVIRGVVPLAMHGSGDGSGDGYGDGYGYGYGYGDGDGYGYGYGDGDGYGYGYGYGDGDGYGDGYGYGDGTEDGDGYGYGDGDGDCDCSDCFRGMRSSSTD